MSAQTDERERPTRGFSPLSRVRVLEIGASPAIGFAGRLLSELGAQVTVALTPRCLGQDQPIEGPDDAAFRFLTDGKSVTSSPADLREAVRAANIILHEEVEFKFKSEIEKRAGFESGCVIASCTPYGNSGPKREWKGTELTLFQGSGEGYLMPGGLAREDKPDGPPIRLTRHLGSYQSGITLAMASVASLRRSRQRGQPEWLDVSGQEAQLSLNYMAISRYVDGTLETRANRDFKYGGVLPCLDGFVELLTIEQKQWVQLCHALGDPEWSRNPNLSDAVERAKHGSEINKHLKQWSRVRHVQQVVEELRSFDVPCGPFLPPQALFSAPQLAHRGFFRESPGSTHMPSSPWLIKRGSACDPSRPGPGAAKGAASLATSLPLEGVRVVDFTSHAAGPFCGLMLALLGCEVIRVESKTHVDINRRPHPVYGRLNVPNFDHMAGPKRAVSLNLKSPGGVALAKELIAKSDLVIENFRPGVMERLGLDWDSLHEANPGLAMVSLSAYGQTGPDARRPGYAPIFAAEGGLGYMTGYADGPPCELRNNMDHTAGIAAAVAAVALLECKSARGIGAYADVSASEVAAMLVGESIVEAAAGITSKRLGNAHERWAPHNVYRALGEDAWVAIAVRSDPEWHKLAQIIGQQELQRPEFGSAEGRAQKSSWLDDQISQWTATRSAQDIAHALQAQGIAAEVSMSARHLLEDEHLGARGAFVTLNHPLHGARPTVEAPWRLAGIARVYSQWSADLGAHNQEVICDLLGHSREELDDFVAQQSVY